MNYTEINTRDDFTKIINDHAYSRCLEVGLGYGANAIHLLKNSNVNILFGVENWSVKNPRNRQELTKSELFKFGDRFSLVELDSLKAVEEFEDDMLDYVYIDGDHRYESVLSDFISWYPKVKQGGFFGGHDYVLTRKCGVVQATNEFFSDIGRSFNLTNEPNENNQNKSFWIIK